MYNFPIYITIILCSYLVCSIDLFLLLRTYRNDICRNFDIFINL